MTDEIRVRTYIAYIQKTEASDGQRKLPFIKNQYIEMRQGEEYRIEKPAAYKTS